MSYDNFTTVLDRPKPGTYSYVIIISYLGPLCIIICNIIVGSIDLNVEEICIMRKQYKIILYLA